MRKINIEPYTVEVVQPSGEEEEIPYNVVMSIENIVMASGGMTSQRLSMPDVLRNARIVEKVKGAAKDNKNFILLEEAEYGIIKDSFEAFSGFGKNEVELCKRINDAEMVAVTEAT